MHYDGAGPQGWLVSLATSRDLLHWVKKGVVLPLGPSGARDSKTASYGTTYRAGKKWFMFYLATPFVSPLPDRVPIAPYYTLLATARRPEGPWEKQYEVDPFHPLPGTYYDGSASPGAILKRGNEYLQFFSCCKIRPNAPGLRTIGIARTSNLTSKWTIDPHPALPNTEQIENSSIIRSNNRWWMFTNHIGIDSNGREYADAIWVYWSADVNHWDPANKAIVLDESTQKDHARCIGLPSVIQVGKKLAMFYDTPGGPDIGNMRRNIGLAWLDLPLHPPA